MSGPSTGTTSGPTYPCAATASASRSSRTYAWARPRSPPGCAASFQPCGPSSVGRSASSADARPTRSLHGPRAASVTVNGMPDHLRRRRVEQVADHDALRLEHVGTRPRPGARDRRAAHRAAPTRRPHGRGDRRLTEHARAVVEHGGLPRRDAAQGAVDGHGDRPVGQHASPRGHRGAVRAHLQRASRRCRPARANQTARSACTTSTDRSSRRPHDHAVLHRLDREHVPRLAVGSGPTRSRAHGAVRRCRRTHRRACPAPSPDASTISPGCDPSRERRKPCVSPSATKQMS